MIKIKSLMFFFKKMRKNLSRGVKTGLKHIEKRILTKLDEIIRGKVFLSWHKINDKKGH
jgi:hypothetical protein